MSDEIRNPLTAMTKHEAPFVADDLSEAWAMGYNAALAVKLAVRPLEWHQIQATPVRWVGHQVDAASPDYNLHLTADSPDVFAWGLDGEGWHGFCDTIEAAQAAAQADYTARILAALDLGSTP